MSETLLSSRNLAFELYEVLDAEALTQRERFADHNRETFDAALTTARSIAEKLFAPHNRKNDETSRSTSTARVLIPEVKPAVDAFSKPVSRTPRAASNRAACNCRICCRKPASRTSSRPTRHLVLPVPDHGRGQPDRELRHEEQKRLFLQPMIDGRFFGTMALTEPHAGSSLADIRTRAEPAGDGSYRIKGNKIFISGGDHPLSENIVHMVLAKLPDAPAGVKGIAVHRARSFWSTMTAASAAQRRAAGRAVPQDGLARHHLHGAELRRQRPVRRLPGGQAAPRPGLHVPDDERGAHRRRHGRGDARLRRLPVFLEYARERPQGRLPDAKDPTTAPVPIIEHADVGACC
jgi:butyryl-CoA dehydrogenase